MTQFQTIEEIAQDVFTGLDEDSKGALRAVKKEGMIRFHMSAGMSIRNKYGLWDHQLTKDGKHPDDVSQEILQRVWELCNA